MTCSIISTVTPLWAMPCTTGIISAISCGFRPANTSSSSSKRGRVASARANSRRLRPATVRSLASLSSCGLRPTCSATDSANSSACARRGKCRCAPTAMFSRTVCAAKGCTIWNVRVRPMRAFRCGGWPVMSWPANTTRPVSGVRKPDMSANKVVLPAPFGPIKALRRPSFTDRLTFCTAFKPPKDLPTPSICSSVLMICLRQTCCRATTAAA